MNISEKRVKFHFKTILENSSTKLGYTRLSYSDEDKKVRNYLKSQAKDLEAAYKEDSIGNIRIIYNPDNLNKKSLLIGSHIDTVPNGGKYDGLSGVISALEVLEVINENDIKLKNPVELIIFAEEEGSNFGSTMLGSKYISGKINKDDLKNLYNDEGESAYNFIQAKGFKFSNEKDFLISRNNELGMIELHVEQGGVLDNENMNIGIVDAIAGMNSVKVTLKGKSNHAGTTPMDMRQDPLLAAGEMIYKIPEIVTGNSSAVATVGKIHVKPNASNVIADEVVFFIDIRDVIQENINKLTEEINLLCKSVANSSQVAIEIETIGSSEVVEMDRHLVRIIEEEAEKENIKYKKMNSGAVHDNAMLNDIIPTAMIFVPSIDGISHSPYEETSMEDIITGTKLLLNTVLKIVSK